MSWLLGYNHRKIHTINSGSGAGTDYQVLFKIYYGSGTDGTETVNGETIGKVYLNNHSQANFNDVRFTNLSNTVYTYKRTSKVDSDYAVFAVKVNEDLDSDRQIYIYYGNSGASDASSDDTFIDVITGVVGAWMMNEADSGSAVVDHSGNSNDGTPTGTTVVDGKFAGTKARNFDGASVITVLHDAVLIPQNISIISWLKPIDKTAWNTIVEKRTVAVNNGYLVVGRGDNQKVFFPVGGSGSASTSSVNNNIWTFVSATYDQTNTKIYFDDGAPEDTDNIGAKVINDSGSLLIGKDRFNNFAKCVIQNLVIFNYALEQTEISNIYSNFGDPSLEAGKVLVRKWATTSLPNHGVWKSEEGIIMGTGNLIWS